MLLFGACLPSLPALFALAILWAFRLAARTARRRVEVASAELVEDVRSLASRNASERIRPLLESMDTPFSRGLLSMLYGGGDSAGSIDEGIRSRLRKEGVGKVSVADRFVGVIAGILVGYAALLLLLAASGPSLHQLWPDLFLLFVILFGPLAAAVVAVRIVLALGRERRILALRLDALAREALFALMPPTPP
ncbi:MAG: hypothetical protein AAB434_04335 [Planctomycetota bacterium]